jgi:hypothetical protein
MLAAPGQVLRIVTFTTGGASWPPTSSPMLAAPGQVACVLVLLTSAAKARIDVRLARFTTLEDAWAYSEPVRLT